MRARGSSLRLTFALFFLNAKVAATVVDGVVLWIGKASIRSHLSIVDLAGSERASRTGNRGKELTEAAAINRTFMALGRCIETLQWNQKKKGKLRYRNQGRSVAFIIHIYIYIYMTIIVE